MFLLKNEKKTGGDREVRLRGAEKACLARLRFSASLSLLEAPPSASHAPRASRRAFHNYAHLEIVNLACIMPTWKSYQMALPLLIEGAYYLKVTSYGKV